MLTMTDYCKLLFLDQKCIWMNSNTFQIGLFTNNYTPARNSVLSNFVEPTLTQFPGYARLTASGIWPFPVINGAGFAQTTPAVLQSFAPSAIGTGCSVYGYFCYYPSTGNILFGELNPAGPTVGVGLTLLPYIVQLQFSESQFNPALP